MKRVHQTVLIAATVLASWLGMQAVHECGHALGALATGGEVRRIVLHPLTISQTDLARNPHPLAVVWLGPTFGVLCPLALWAVAESFAMPGSFVLRFFAGFCLIANGAYIAIGSFDHVGDCGEMLRHGSHPSQLWAFGVVTVPLGFWLWHRQGAYFGLGAANGAVDVRVVCITLLAALVLLVIGFLVGG